VLGPYLQRCARELPGCEALETLGRLYQGLRYGRKEEGEREFEALLRRLRKKCGKRGNSSR
jgi:hypothetical protein